MKNSLNFNFLIGFGVIITLIGIMFSSLEIFFLNELNLFFNFTYEDAKQIGFGLIGIGIIIVCLGAVGIKVEDHGFDFWALGASISYTGVLFLMTPFILLMLNIPLSQLASIGLIILGIIFALFGFFYEEYELNMRFSAYLRELQDILSGISPIRIIIASLLSFITLLSIRYRSSLIPVIGRYETYGFFFGLITLTFAVILVDRAIKFLLALIGGVKTYFQYIGSAFKNFPQIFITALQKLVKSITGAFIVVWERFKGFSLQLIHHNYSITLIVGIFIVLIEYSQLQQVSLLIIFVFLATVKMGVTYSSNLVQGINRINSALYSTSFKFQKSTLQLFRRKIMCPNCSTLNNLSWYHCSECGMGIPRCLVCRIPIQEDQEIIQCPFCSYPAHKNHWDEWILMRKSCPRCRNIIIEQEN